MILAAHHAQFRVMADTTAGANPFSRWCGAIAAASKALNLLKNKMAVAAWRQSRSNPRIVRAHGLWHGRDDVLMTALNGAQGAIYSDRQPHPHAGNPEGA